MGWAARERTSVVVAFPRRLGASTRRAQPSQSAGRSHHASPLVLGRLRGPKDLRGATTLEEQALPLAIMACFAALATIQLVLTW